MKFGGNIEIMIWFENYYKFFNFQCQPTQKLKTEMMMKKSTTTMILKNSWQEVTKELWISPRFLSWLENSKKTQLPSSGLKFIDGERSGKKEELANLNSSRTKKVDSFEFCSEPIRPTNVWWTIWCRLSKFSASLSSWRPAIMLGLGLLMILAMRSQKQKSSARSLPQKKTSTNSKPSSKTQVLKTQRLWHLPLKPKKKNNPKKANKHK